MTSPPTSSPPPTSPLSTNMRKPPTRSLPLTTNTTLPLPHTYLHLSLLTPSSVLSPQNSPPIDAITARTYLTAALTQFLGLTGTAIAIDILKVEGRDCWLRVAREDGAAVERAVVAWAGEGVAWRIRGVGGWLGGLVGRGGREVFE
ncbi:hypothetical protein MMC32_002636 [Xylographa parallela]|nr:hypothetical protein [Xylographa parallela]